MVSWQNFSWGVSHQCLLSNYCTSTTEKQLYYNNPDYQPKSIALLPHFWPIILHLPTTEHTRETWVEQVWESKTQKKKINKNIQQTSLIRSNHERKLPISNFPEMGALRLQAHDQPQIEQTFSSFFDLSKWIGYLEVSLSYPYFGGWGSRPAPYELYPSFILCRGIPQSRRGSEKTHDAANPMD